MKEQTLSQIAYERIRKDIISCRIYPGERIRINETVERLTLNLSAVREALSRLTAEGLVVATQQRGFRAAPISLEDLRDLTPVRIEIEISCLRRSLRNGDLNWEANLAAAFHRLANTPRFASEFSRQSSDAFASAHDEFHYALIAACDNKWLLRIRDVLYLQWERYRRLANQKSNYERDLDKEHLELYKAAISRDENLISDLFEIHLQKMTEIIINNKDFFSSPLMNFSDT